MQNITECCKSVNPCDAVCLLENVLIDLIGGNFVTNYKVGAESFSFAKPSVKSVQDLLVFFEKKCNVAQGKPSRERASVCFIHTDSECGVCHSSGGCGC